MPGSLAEQERNAIELFARADRLVPDNHSVRKHALSHAIKLAHSSHTSLKRMAAFNIAKFFKAFPELEEDAINAVYDLCEDQDPNIRIEGYKAIVRMSEEQPRWLERNVDVLVQLLQSDEPEEVAVVKTALIQHLEFDSKVTLGVLCDQIVPPDDPMEDEDRTIRERLRALVVAFLAEDARQPLLSQLQRQGRRAADQEDSLIDTLIKAISKSGAADTTKIIADILVFLPSFNDSRPTRHGNSLVSMLLARAGSALREDLAPGRNPANLDQSRVYLELSDLLCRAKSAAEPVQLLRFYCTSSLMGKMTLGRLSRESRAFFIASLAGALAACSSQKSPESSELASMRRQVVDALSVILPFIIQVAPSDAQAWGSCEILLQTCQQRKEQQANWAVPTPLHTLLTEIARLADIQGCPESKRAADLSRALTRPPMHAQQQTTQSQHPLPAKPPPPSSPPLPPDAKSSADAPPPSKRKAAAREDPVVPQERNGAQQKLNIRGQHTRQRRPPKDTTTTSSSSLQHGTSTPVEPVEDGDQRQQQRSTATKRLKVADGETPSLLLRMGATQPQRRSPGGRGRQGSKAKSSPTARSDLPTPAGTPDLPGGISIKGAARSRPHPHSLLERIQGEGT
ncbi:Apoptosis inhibitory protein 5 (API5) domain containing protein [Lactarius tabidus]